HPPQHHSFLTALMHIARRQRPESLPRSAPASAVQAHRPERRIAAPRLSAPPRFQGLHQQTLSSKPRNRPLPPEARPARKRRGSAWPAWLLLHFPRKRGGSRKESRNTLSCR